MSDIVTLVSTRPSQNQTITVTIPESMVQLLDWISANVKNPDGTPKYQYGMNVIFRDVIDLLVPFWQQQYTDGQIAPLQAQIDAARAQIGQTVTDGVAQLVVVGP